MKELSLIEIRKIQIDILSHFGDFCEKNNIQYFLCNGTLLGAVKYGGYIPWDDDIDVCLPRSEYDRFIALYAKESDPRFELRAFELDSKFLFPFSKLSDTQTHLLEGYAKDMDLGVNIDIFPIDNWGNSIQEISKLYRKMERLRRGLTWAKTDKYVSSSKIKTICKVLLATFHRIIGGERYCKKIITLAAMNAPCRYIGNCVWGFYGVGEALPREQFQESVPVIFEGKTYPAPIGYDQYLTGLYGDYRKDPPPEKQISHHKFKVYLKSNV